MHGSAACAQHISKRFNTHRPHFWAFSICYVVVCGAAEATCIILTGTFLHPTCSCQWACRQTKGVLAYKTEQLVCANIETCWFAKSSVVHICTLRDMLNLQLQPLQDPPSSLAVLILNLGSYHHLCCHTCIQRAIWAKHTATASMCWAAPGNCFLHCHFFFKNKWGNGLSVVKMG